MRAELIVARLVLSKSLTFCILVKKYNQYKKGSLRFGRKLKSSAF